MYMCLFSAGPNTVKVYVWAGCSWEGATRVRIFEGIMNAEAHVYILKKALLPSTRFLYAGKKFRFMQGNDPKHTSKHAREFFAENGIQWWKTPPESLDLNPIENLWHE